ncbi:MAG: peptidoglycan DD-metalloendopeptidase family protein [Chloroflexota bacterium]
MPKHYPLNTRLLFLILCYFYLQSNGVAVAQTNSADWVSYTVTPGDTWTALAWRHRVSADALKGANPHPNRFRQPVIGQTVQVPPTADERLGRLVQDDRSLLQISADTGIPALQLALINDMPLATHPRPDRAIFAPGDSVIKDFPAGLTSLSFSHPLARAGEGMAFSGVRNQTILSGRSQIGSKAGTLFVDNERSNAIGLLATGAFFWEGTPHIDIVTVLPSHKPSCQNNLAPECQKTYLWTQPWLFEKKQWTYNDITLTGAAAQIDAEAIAAERARLFEIWRQVPSSNFRPATTFHRPVESFLFESSFFGARRSYNGGPYSSYHEGHDYAAYRGTAVLAPESGTVVVAETLYVRGGAVIIDHGLGIYTGVYHLDTVEIEVGAQPERGQKVGTVGSTGLSTGPHLHWDLLVNGIWVDPKTWQNMGMNCWILAALERPC